MPTDTASSTIVDSASPPSVFSRTKWVFTTGEAGAACRLSQQTIIRACNSQKLRHWKVPGSKFRRINRNELLKFMKAEKIPTCAIEGEPTLLLIGVGATVNAALTTEFSAKNLGAVIGARSLFNAGQLVTAHCVEATLIAGALFSTPEQLQEFIRERNENYAQWVRIFFEISMTWIVMRVTLTS